MADEPMLENEHVPLTDTELAEVVRRLVDDEPQIREMTRRWAVIAVRQLRAALAQRTAELDKQNLVASKLLQALSEAKDEVAIQRGRAEQAEAALTAPVHVAVSPIHTEEDNTGSLESTDLFVTGRGVSLLVNMTVEGELTYSLGVDGLPTQSGTVEWKSEVPIARLQPAKETQR